jgi:hypothetical protein
VFIIFSVDEVSAFVFAVVIVVDIGNRNPFRRFRPAATTTLWIRIRRGRKIVTLNTRWVTRSTGNSIEYKLTFPFKCTHYSEAALLDLWRINKQRRNNQ